MTDKPKAAIDIDEVLQRPLASVSATDLLQVLNHPKVWHPSIALLPDKKKYELWVEEGIVVRITVGEILQKLRGEKKKLELEPFPDLAARVLPPNLGYAQLVEDVARRVEERLGHK